MVNKLMPFAKIKNWKEVVDQFGYDIAKRLSKELRSKIDEAKPDNIAIEYNPEKTEAIALFEYQGKEGMEYVFEYTGTAN